MKMEWYLFYLGVPWQGGIQNERMFQIIEAPLPPDNRQNWFSCE